MNNPERSVIVIGLNNGINKQIPNDHIAPFSLTIKYTKWANDSFSKDWKMD